MAAVPPEPSRDAAISSASGSIGGCKPGSLGEYREYLLYIAEQELSGELRAKVAPSDVVQDAMLKAHRDMGQYQGSTDSEMRSWLRTILLRTVLDAHRRYFVTSRRRADLEKPLDQWSAIPADDETPSVQFARLEECEALFQALSRLSEDHRVVLRMRNWEGASFAAIGDALGRTPDAVRKLWVRAVDQLRREWRCDHERPVDEGGAART